MVLWDEERGGQDDPEDRIALEWGLADARRFLVKLQVAQTALTDLALECKDTVAREAIRTCVHSLIGFEVGLQVAVQKAEGRPLSDRGIDKDEEREASPDR